MNNNSSISNCRENPLRADMDLVNQMSEWERLNGKIVTEPLMSHDELIKQRSCRSLNEEACDINAKKNKQRLKQLQREADFKKRSNASLN